MYNTLWFVGAIIAACPVFGTIKYTSEALWRIPVGMQTAMPAIQFIGIWFLPECPRWLCAKRLYDILYYDNLLRARECFVHEGCMYALVDDLLLTLE